jgi:FeS assembly protein SufB
MATDARDLSQAPERINPAPENVDLGAYKYGWHDPVSSVFTPKKGLSHEVVEEISQMKNEPEWMRKFRHKSLDYFLRRPMPQWGGDLNKIDFNDIYYFLRATEKQAASWDDLPADIKNTYDRLGIPEAEKQRLIAGVAAQYECLVGDTRIWTANRGFVYIKEIQPGDQVFSYDEEAGRFITALVRAAAQTDVRQTFEIQVGKRAIRATDNHPVLALRDERKPGQQRARYAKRWTTVGELRVGDFVAVPRDLPELGQEFTLPAAEGLPVPAVASTDLLWLLGFFVGDGNLHISRRTWRVQFAVPDTDVEVRAEIARIVRELFGLRVIEADKYCVVVNSKALVQWIERLGFAGLAHTKRVPDWVYGLTLAQRLAFLGGWIDADGHIRPEASGSVILTCVNLPMLQQAAELATLCGLEASGPWEFQSPHVKDPSRMLTGFRLGISGDFERLDCRNPRRTERFGRRRYHHSSKSASGTTISAHITDHLGFARVTAIMPAMVEPVYDIEVDGPHNFIAEGMVVHNSEVVYHKVREDLEAQGVIFVDTDTALREHEDLFREHWATVIPPNDNKFAALNSAVWSGGSFIWVPEGIQVEIPLQAYFRINAQNMGQFERTLIIAEPGANVHYVEGCTAPLYSTDSLHSAVVEIIVKPHAKVRYTTIQNWSNNVYNLVTKRAVAQEGATMEWIDANIGSKLTMKYPAVILAGQHAHGEVLSVAFAGEGQHQDAGAKLTFAAPNTTGQIISKSISRDGGRTSYRGLIKVEEGAGGTKATVRCDALLLDEESRSDTYPYTDVKEEDVTLGHEATVSKIGDDQLFYLRSRGLTEAEATAMIVRGFVEPISKELPMEYALELNRLVTLQMEGAVG